MIENRKILRIRKLGLEDSADADVRHLSPGERMEMVWPLTIQAWAFKGEDIAEQRLQRHLVRVIRGGS